MDINRLIALLTLIQYGTFEDPNGPRADQREACRIEACQIASKLSGVWVSERDKPEQTGKE